MGGRNKTADKHQYTLEYLRKRFIRIYPLFFASVSSLFVVGMVSDVFSISLTQYVTSVLGVSWLFPPVIPTGWFCSIIIFYFALSSLFFLIQKDRCRIIAMILFYISILIMSFFITMDKRVLLY